MRSGGDGGTLEKGVEHLPSKHATADREGKRLRKNRTENQQIP